MVHLLLIHYSSLVDVVCVAVDNVDADGAVHVVGEGVLADERRRGGEHPGHLDRPVQGLGLARVGNHQQLVVPG